MSKKLVEYLPPLFKDLREIVAITAALQPEADALLSRAEDILKEGDFDRMSEYGISRWERILGIFPEPYLSIEERRFAVKANLLSSAVYSEKVIREMLNRLVGEENYLMMRDLSEGKQSIDVELRIANKRLYPMIYGFLDRVVSAEIFLNVFVNWNRWNDCAPYIWNVLSARTWRSVKEEEL